LKDRQHYHDCCMQQIVMHSIVVSQHNSLHVDQLAVSICKYLHVHD
uniref:Ovule protein n=1 Tax=Brugia timori TaxID=42155 RepID=A0A0R3QCC0_9BILA